MIKEARKFRLRDYALIFDYQDSKEETIQGLRRAISDKNPVIVGMNITFDFFDLNHQNFFWKPSKDAIVVTRHAMVVIGYDHEKENVEIMNSFGTEWGNDCLLYTSPSPRDATLSRMPSSA